MNVFGLLIEQMQGILNSGGPAELESEFEGVCRLFAGDSVTDRLRSLDISDFEAELHANSVEALARARKSGARAIYFEYDLDNGWSSNFFICKDYSPLDKHKDYGDDDWACEWVDELRGPECPSFADAYSEFGYRDEPAKMGPTLLLIARTIAAFARATSKLEPGNIALTLAFHDQDPIMRVHEPK